MTRTDYDDFAERYQQEIDQAVSFAGRDHDFFTRTKADELVSIVRRHLGEPANTHALDVGCGVGLTDRFLEGAFASLTGVDISPGVLARAATANPWARYKLYGGTRLPFEAGTFDLAFAICVVQVLEPEARGSFVAELARVTRANGLVVAFEHNPFNPLTRLVARRCAFGRDAKMLRLSELRRLFAASGLEIVDAAHLLVFPSRRRRLLRLERGVRRAPLGAQYYVVGRRA